MTWRLRDGDGALAPDGLVRTRRAVESGGGDAAILKPDFVGPPPQVDLAAAQPQGDRAMPASHCEARMGGPRRNGIQRINGIDQSIGAGFPSGFAPNGWLDSRHWKWSVERHEELIVMLRSAEREWLGGAPGGGATAAWDVPARLGTESVFVTGFLTGGVM